MSTGISTARYLTELSDLSLPCRSTGQEVRAALQIHDQKEAWEISKRDWPSRSIIVSIDGVARGSNFRFLAGRWLPDSDSSVSIIYAGCMGRVTSIRGEGLF